MKIIVIAKEKQTYIFENAKIKETKGLYTEIYEYKNNNTIEIKTKTYIKNSEILRIIEEND